ncbi:hypothetical protein E5D57_002933 [Metarhizium anisopliae]|nr:hypothetical protein E5D57_002933 [Metarhizium anisopliae]
MSADWKMDEDSDIAAGQQMSFLRFPTEIQMQILSQLCCHCTQEPKCPETALALHNCSLVCKSWRAITVPLMWHQLSLSGNRWVKFLTGLFSEKPQLAKHVESIRCDLLDDPQVARDLSLRQTAVTLGMTRPGPDYFLLPYAYHYESNVILGMQVLLAVTDKIKNLSLRGIWTSGLFKYLANRQGQRGMRYIFPELRSVLIQGVPSPCRACWRDYAHGDRRLDCRFLLQTAPKLHTLELYGMGVFDVPMDERATNLLRQPLPTHLRNIRFCNSAFLGDEDQELFLRPLIGHCAALERFTMQLWVCYCLFFNAVRTTRLVSPGDLVDMLETQKNSLKYLELNYLDPHDVLYHIDHGSGNDSDEAASVVQITTNAWYASPNLATFPALEELHIDEHSFCHHWQTPSHVEDGPQTCLTDIVSPSVQRLLVLVRPKSRAWGDIRHFCNQVARGRYPNLQRLNIVFHVSDCRIPDFLQAPDKVPQAMMFRTKARAVKHLLEATNVVFGAAVLAHDTFESVTKVFRSLSDDMEEWLGIETIELPLKSQEDDGAPEVCGN